MTSEVRLIKENLFMSSLYGTLRGIFVHTLIHPLDVIKIRQQCSQEHISCSQVALKILREEGIGAFYKGLFSQLLKTSIKQIWCWPIITGLPILLQRYHAGNLQQQALTGLTIATVDAIISTPLERAKIVSAFTGTSKFSLKDIYKDGWKGFTIHWSKLAVNWAVFLIAQKHIRDQFHSSSAQPLSLLQLSTIGVLVAVIVSLASAPFDAANTLKQAQNLHFSQLLNRQRIFQLYRGWPINSLSLVIHNIASVIVIEKLQKTNQ